MKENRLGGTPETIQMREGFVEHLDEMKNVDIRTVEKDSLVDIKDVELDTTLSRRECILDFIRQIKNPYCYLDDGVIVKLSFSKGKSMEELIKSSAAQ